MDIPTLEPGDLLTLQDAADRLATSYKTIFRLVTDGHLAAHRVGGQWRIHRDDLADYVFRGALDGADHLDGAVAHGGEL